MLLFLLLNNCHTLFNFCSYCTIFNPTTELVIPIEILIKEAKVEIEIHPVTGETKIRKFSI